MARMAGQDPAHMGPASEVAAQIPGIKVRAISAVIASSPVRVINNKSQGIRIIQSSLVVANTMFSPLVCASKIGRFINER